MKHGMHFASSSTRRKGTWLISGLEAQIGSDPDATDISYVVSFDFSALIAQTGSTQGASDAVRGVARALDGHAVVYVFRQFILVQQNESCQPSELLSLLKDAVASSAAADLRYALLAIPAEVGGIAPVEFSLWIAMLWARAARKLSLEPGAPAPLWNDVLALLLDLVTTPTPTANAELRAFRSDLARIESEWSEVSFDEERIIVVAQDFVGYSRQTTWGSRTVGVGVRDALEAAVEVVRSIANPSPLDLYDLFRLRQSIQQKVDDFELQVRRTLAAEPYARLIPAGADGSLGNDGVLVVINVAAGSRIARVLHDLAAIAGFYPMTTFLSGDSAESLLVQGEQCLAALKAAAHVGVDVEVVAAPCGRCHWFSTDDVDSYVSKQRLLFHHCVRALTG